MLWKKKRVSVGGEETYSTSCIRLQQLRSTDDDSECMDDQITTFSVEAVDASVVTDIDSILFSFQFLHVAGSTSSDERTSLQQRSLH